MQRNKTPKSKDIFEFFSPLPKYPFLPMLITKSMIEVLIQIQFIFFI
jgi:hypothetical protein